MSSSGDLGDEMERAPLDHDTVERILAGTIAPEDLPPGYAEVAALLEAARAEPEHQELAREAETVAAMAETVRTHAPKTLSPTPRRLSMLPRLGRARLALAFVFALLAATTGAAFAGALPAPAQGAASAVLDTVGISVPEGEEQEAYDADENEGDAALEGTLTRLAGNSVTVENAEAGSSLTCSVPTEVALTGVAVGHEVGMECELVDGKLVLKELESEDQQAKVEESDEGSGAEETGESEDHEVAVEEEDEGSGEGSEVNVEEDDEGLDVRSEVEEYEVGKVEVDREDAEDEHEIEVNEQAEDDAADEGQPDEAEDD